MYTEHIWDAAAGIHKPTQEMLDGVIHKGFLKKQGANWKTWRNRFFVLTEHVLYYFSSERAEVPLGAILLAETVIEGADETIDKPWSFLVKPKKSYTGTTEWSARTYYLKAADYVDMNKWISALLSSPLKRSQRITYRPSMYGRLERSESTPISKTISTSPLPTRPVSALFMREETTSPSGQSRRVTINKRQSKVATSEFYTESTSFCYSYSDSDEDKTDGSFAVFE